MGEDGLDGERVLDDGDDALATATAVTGEDVEIEGHEALERAVGAPQPREAVAQNATREALAELLLDEPREAVSVAAVRDFPEKGLQVLADDSVEHGVLGVAGLLRAMGMPHAHG